MPNDLVNTHGKGLTNSLWKYWWSSSDKSEENYSQIFETDCNKHDICYGCVSKALKWISYENGNIKESFTRIHLVRMQCSLFLGVSLQSYKS